MKYCFVFVCQQGDLELKSRLLAASLERYLSCEHEVVAALPHPPAAWGTPSQETLTFLSRLGVRFESITNPIGPGYPIGNKLACLGIPTCADKIVFLDSDILCMRAFAGDARFERFAANIKPADLATFGSDLSSWERAYGAFGMPVPMSRMMATVSGESMPPYFNAGFVAVGRDSGVGPAWVDCARALEDDSRVTDKRPWLDQIALPIALARLGLEADCLDERYNYPAHLKPLDPGQLPWFCHYHYPAVLRGEPLVNALVKDLADEHTDLREAIEASAEWNFLLRPYALTLARNDANPVVPRESARQPTPWPADAARSPDLLITGIPRSGTSYLCKLIHQVDDCVVINEPTAIFHPLAKEPTPWGVSILYRDLRREIRDGISIPNKLHQGEFIEDTAQVDTVEQYLPRISRPDFLLGTKNTLAYLARLPQLRLAMPHARIVACVRHPRDAIASWKTTFQHLANADLESQVVGHSRDPALAERQRERLREIASTTALATRRALAWRHLAEILLDLRDCIELVRYEDLVSDPAASLKRIFASTPGMFAPNLPSDLTTSSPRSKRDALDREDLEAIGAICSDSATRLGYLDAQ